MFILPGTVCSTRTSLLVDTGATTAYFDRTIESQLQEANTRSQVQVLTGSANIREWKYEKVPVAIDGLNEQKVDGIAGDLSGLRELLGEMNLKGVMGMSYLRHVTLQSRGGQLRILSSEQSRLIKGTEYPLNINQAACPLISVTFPLLGERDALVDSGYFDFLGISESHARVLMNSGDAVLLGKSTILTASGVVEQRLIVVREMHILGTRHENVPAVVGTTTKLGIQFVRSRDMTLNFPAQKLLVTDSPRKAMLFPVDASGLRIVWNENNYIVRRIEHDSAASTMDIQPGDRFETIDDKLTSKMSHEEITRLLSMAGKTISLRLKRNTMIHDVGLQLTRKFEYPPKWKPRSTEAEDFFNSLQAEPTK
jgi:predicted aspartyl protease